MMSNFSAAGLLLAMASGMAYAPGSASAQAWPQAKGAGYYQVGFQMVRATSFYEPGGNQIDIPTLADYQFSFYGEHGLTDRITVQAYIPFVERITLNRVAGEETGFVFFEGDAITSLADADVGIRVGLFARNRTSIAANLRIGIPLGVSEQENGLQTGDGEMNQIVAIAVGQSLWPRPGWIQTEIGFNNRLNGYSDEFMYKAEAGYTVLPRLTAIVRARGVLSLRNGVDERLGGTGGLYGNNQQYLAYGLELAYSNTGALGFSLRGEGAAFGENVLAAPAVGASVFMRLPEFRR